MLSKKFVHPIHQTCNKKFDLKLTPIMYYTLMYSLHIIATLSIEYKGPKRQTITYLFD